MQQLLQAHKQLIRTLQESRNPSKGVPIFLRGTEANLKMVPIGSVPIPRLPTVDGLWSLEGVLSLLSR